jgi:Cdc6-like AAA superfamily ATPase
MTTAAEPSWNDLVIRAGRVFSPSAPIDELSLFAGRDSQVRTVVDAINQKGQHVIIYGERGVGKTSLSNVLHAFLGQQDFPVVAPRVQCEALDTFDKVWRRVFEKIELSREKKTIRLQTPVDRESYRASELLNGGEVAPDDVRRILGIVAKGALPIVIVDEFDRLPKERRRPFADTIKTLSDHAVSATVILVGVADSVDELIHEHQSIERALVQVSMPRMSNDEIRQIVKTGLKKLGMTIRPEALQPIILLSQGLPHYTHLIGLYSARAALDAKTLEITEGIVGKAIEKAVDGAQQSISSAWHQATRSQRKDSMFSDVLLSCALAETDLQNTFAAQDVRVPMREITGKPYAITSFAQNLNDFCDEKRGPILTRTGSARKYRYRFVNPLMQPFVIMQGFKGNKINKSLLNKLHKSDD